MMAKPVTVLLVRTGEQPTVEIINQDLKSLYKVLDCTTVELVPIGCGYEIWCDEEGRINGKPYNSCGIVGHYFISRSAGGHLVSLTERQIAEAINYYNAYRNVPDPNEEPTIIGFGSSEELLAATRRMGESVDAQFRAAQLGAK